MCIQITIGRLHFNTKFHSEVSLLAPSFKPEQVWHGLPLCSISLIYFYSRLGINVSPEPCQFRRLPGPRREMRCDGGQQLDSRYAFLFWSGNKRMFCGWSELDGMRTGAYGLVPGWILSVSQRQKAKYDYASFCQIFWGIKNCVFFKLRACFIVAR